MIWQKYLSGKKTMIWHPIEWACKTQSNGHQKTLSGKKTMTWQKYFIRQKDHDLAKRPNQAKRP
jgi:hypothetical protein